MTNEYQHTYRVADVMLKDIAEMTGHTLVARFCSYCGVYMGLKDGNGNTGPSHGICHDCQEEQLAYSQASAGSGLV